MVEAGLRGVSPFRLATTRPESKSTTAKLTARSERPCAAAVRTTGGGAPSTANAAAGEASATASAVCAHHPRILARDRIVIT